MDNCRNAGTKIYTIQYNEQYTNDDTRSKACMKKSLPDNFNFHKKLEETCGLQRKSNASCFDDRSNEIVDGLEEKGDMWRLYSSIIFIFNISVDLPNND